MRYICVGPGINDCFVENIKNLRIEFMKNARIVNIDNECEPMEVLDFSTGLYEPFDEVKKLNGSWASMQEFNEDILPAVRISLLGQIQDREKDVVHVDLGKSLLALYIAYFSVQEGIATNVSFHMPNPEDKEPTFNIGGESAYSNPRNNLRRYLATQIMQKAMTIFIDNPALVTVFNRLFPRINREIHIDPLLQVKELEEKEVENATT